ncbi:MAG: hypothetical protein Q4D62_15000 [Planctomycetia bacterium]|nr:hypothetical protein [Planctomycetia bacterium]
MWPHFRSVQWWVEHAWSVKTHVLIGVTATILLILSLAGAIFYQCQVSRLANQFLRLQVLGPRNIFVETNVVSGAEILSPPCFYHIETRSPYGEAIGQVQMEVALHRPSGKTSFWKHREKTDHHGLLEVDLPQNDELPQQVELKMTAVRGANEDQFRAFLRVKKVDSGEWKPCREPLPEILPDALPLPEVGNVMMERYGQQMAKSGHTTLLLSPSMQLKKRILRGEETAAIQVFSHVPKKPVLVGIWKGNVLITSRPVVTGKSVRNVSLPIPSGWEGLMEVVLFDYSISPPRILQQELIYQVPREEISQEERLSIEAYWNREVERITSEAFRQSQCGMEYFAPETLLEKGEEQVENKMAEQLRVWEFLLHGAIVPRYPEDENWPSREMRGLESVLTQGFLGMVSDEEQTAWEEVAEKALKIQSIFGQGDGNFEKKQRLVERHAPIVYDGLQKLERQYHHELAHYRNHVRHGLRGLVCIILCIALCLQLLVMMMAILRIPTGWRVWLATWSVLAVACTFSLIIAAYSDFGKDAQSTIFHSYLGEPTTHWEGKK